MYIKHIFRIGDGIHYRIYVYYLFYKICFFSLGGGDFLSLIIFIRVNISCLLIFVGFCMLHKRQKQKLYIIFFTGDKTRRDTVQCLRCVPSLDGYVSSSQKGAIVIWNSSVRNTRLVLDFMYHSSVPVVKMRKFTWFCFIFSYECKPA